MLFLSKTCPALIYGQYVCVCTLEEALLTILVQDLWSWHLKAEVNIQSHAMTATAACRIKKWKSDNMVLKHKIRSWCGMLLISDASMYVVSTVESEPRKLIMKNVKLLCKGNDLDIIYWLILKCCLLLRKMTAQLKNGLVFFCCCCCRTLALWTLQILFYF